MQGNSTFSKEATVGLSEKCSFGKLREASQKGDSVRMLTIPRPVRAARRLLSSSFLHYSLIASTVAYFSFVEADAVNHGLGCLSTRRWSTCLRASTYRFSNTSTTLCCPDRSQPHTLTSVFHHKYQYYCIRNISGYLWSVQDSFRRLLRRESVADASTVQFRHAT